MTWNQENFSTFSSFLLSPPNAGSSRMIDGVQMSPYSLTSARGPFKPIRFGNEGVDALLFRKQSHSILKPNLHVRLNLSPTQRHSSLLDYVGCVGKGALWLSSNVRVINMVHTADRQTYQSDPCMSSCTTFRLHTQILILKKYIYHWHSLNYYSR